MEENRLRKTQRGRQRGSGGGGEIYSVFKGKKKGKDSGGTKN